MEKRRPHYSLEGFKRICGNAATLAMTVSAAEDAYALGYRRADITGIIRRLEGSMFYKSVTSRDDHREWQDVYHFPIGDGRYIYVKFREDKITVFKVLSFKEK